MRDELLGYYERELVFLRKMGAEFSKRYPKIAARLELEEEVVEDPHVERMIEAFAFLSARVAMKLDDEFPEITESFINVLYPHYQAPIPSMSVVEMSYGSENDQLTSVDTLPRGTTLHSKPVQGSPCTFRTSYDTHLFPIKLKEAALESPAPKDGRGMFAESAIRMSFKCFGGSNLHELKLAENDEPPDHLRFFLNGDPQLVYSLYEIILNHTSYVEIRPVEAPLDSSDLQTITNIQLNLPDPVILPPDSIKPVGFEEDEAMIPYTKRSFAGYRLLTEYFTFPYKFLFFDIYGIDQAIQRKFGSHFEILIHLKDIVPPTAPVSTDTFKLGCVPIVNLFRRTADPLYLSQQKYEYHLIADVHRQESTEIYSIDGLVSTDPKTNETQEFSPFYSLNHIGSEKKERSFWYASRRQSQRQNDEGTEIYVSFVDSTFNPRVPGVDIVTAKTTCSNRDLPAKLPFGGKGSDFEVEGSALVTSVRCLTKPTETIRPPRRRGAQWRLISHLNLNYLSLVNSEDGKPEALREILNLYNFAESSPVRNMILGITGIEAKPVIRRIGQRVGAGFVRGLETKIVFDEEQFVGSGMYLFASVLERFLGTYTSLNSFNQLVIESEQREGEIKRWRPRTGEQVLL